MFVLPYSVNQQEAWDSFVRKSKNGAFFFERAYIDLQAERYLDCSLIVCNDFVSSDDSDLKVHDDAIVALFPAHFIEKEACVVSHEGLPFGGLILSENTTQNDVMEIMYSVLSYCCDMLQAQQVVYKPSPTIFHRFPSQEDLYALFRVDAKRVECNVHTVVYQRHALKIRHSRLEKARQATSDGVYIERLKGFQDDEVKRFWQLLHDKAMQPVTHSEDEICQLLKRFPQNVRALEVKKDERLLACCLLFKTHNMLHVQYIARADKDEHNGAMDVLFKHLLSGTYQQIEYIDFGANTAEHGQILVEELQRKKEDFGGRTICYDTFSLQLNRHLIQHLMPKKGNETKDIKFLDLRAINDRFEPELTKAIERVMLSGWYLYGKEIERFERLYADYCGVKHCVMVGNGLEALTIALRAYKQLRGWEAEDEVIVPSNTYIASILAVSNAGLKPVLCEPSMTDYLIDPEQIKKLITPRTRAIMPVHLYGAACDMGPIMQLAESNQLVVLEDAAQAHGAMYRGKRVGALGHAAGVSFYPGKNLGALSDSGCITTNDDALAQLVRTMANYGSSKKYVNDVKGFNSRSDEFQAAILAVKLAQLDKDNARRREIASLYHQLIDNPLVTTPSPFKQPERHVWHIYALRCPYREELQAFLLKNGIHTMVHYPIPPHKQAAYSEWNDLHFPLSERIHREELSLPISPVLSDEQVRRIAEVINQFVVE